MRAEVFESAGGKKSEKNKQTNMAQITAEGKRRSGIGRVVDL